MKLTPNKFKKIIQEELEKMMLKVETFDTGTAGDEVGGMTLQQKIKHCKDNGGEWEAGQCSKGLEEKKLTSKARNALPDSDFVYPGERKYPIHDLSHAKNALSRASGTSEEEKVDAAVYKKYPSLKKNKKKGK